jgi:formylglycine-generating enzyme required for sulfatase activity
LVFEENFDGKSKMETFYWEAKEAGSVANGEIIMVPGMHVYPKTYEELSDFVIEVKFRNLDPGKSIQPFVWLNWNGSFPKLRALQFALSSEAEDMGTYIVTDNNFQEFRMNRRLFDYQLEKYNIMKIWVIGSTYQIYFNESLVDAFEDSTYQKGEFLVGLYQGSQGKMAVDYIRIYSIQYTPVANNSPVSPDVVSQVSEIDGMVQVSVPAGEFQMGSNERNDNEKPVHIVWLDAFWIDQTEVTNALYAKCVATGNCRDMANYPEKSSHPVVGVDWTNAATYCQWAGRRLPSEAEWEKAARGTDGRTYPWGEGIDCKKANYQSGCKGDTSAVGSYPDGASPYGALNMVGNVWEWVADWYSDTYYRSSLQENPKGPDSGDGRVLRGGSWDNNEMRVRGSPRDGFYPINGLRTIGFRCAASQ